ncbi:putative toxin-antitoxin system toxin component, PIN family [Pseudorhodoferax sp. Leaf274]|uniref:putative toxin-antitoxin system toxin component, PIN family n=1 Tax=Pseudorhodoferax sp. Leaf274 TaxID=1736318 RepID=UPI00070333B2|nr:putative toxin-antitoxin system toxin component, PIN family [Pseudorhodoferax sp. Leaf274]KQP49971.1 toxin-antitoxin system toxin component, PIN family protein [Pseudorhodoferax sp. Leaf274]
MRLVLDTNTALSGLLWGGTPSHLIDAVLAQRIEIATSAALLAELHGVLSRDKFTRQLTRRGLTVDDVFHGYAAMSIVVTPAAMAPTILRDPADDAVLAAALAARADLIVSGDAHLLDLKHFQGMAIVTASAAVQHIGPIA